MVVAMKQNLWHALLAMSSAAGNVVLVAAVDGQRLRGGRKMADGYSYNDIFSLALRDSDGDGSLGFGSPRSRSRSRRIQVQDGNSNNDDLEAQYVNECISYLLAKDIASDGIISQNDFAQMLLHQCNLDNDTDHTCPQFKGKLKFENIDLALQLKFIDGICHHESFADRYDCIHGLNQMWLEGNEFGFRVTEDGIGEVEEEVGDLVKEMCKDTYVEAIVMGFARSAVPTATPSMATTPKPSNVLTDSPTRRPSHAPNKPSQVPTATPTVAPTPKPSRARTNLPSRRPSRAPNKPSDAPMRTPSAAPTPKPSRKRTSPPSRRPSRAPVTPTDEPSTGNLIVPPTSVPTAALSTNSPVEHHHLSRQPIASAVTRYPSVPPSFLSELPEMVIVPTLSPSVGPTLQETEAPMAKLSFAPTRSPSVPPSSLPPVVTYPPSTSSSAPSHRPTLQHQPHDAPSTSSSESFADECASHLLTPEISKDKIVSQTEFASFLLRHCIRAGLCDDAMDISFEELEVGLQLEFVWGACSNRMANGHDEHGGTIECIEGLEAMWRSGEEFGFDASTKNLESRVRDMCWMSFGYVLEMGLTETPAPISLTTSPSASPLAGMMEDFPTTELQSESPSTFTTKGNGDGNTDPTSIPSENEGSVSRGAIIGMSFALALSMTVACIMYAYRRRLADSSPDADAYSVKEANHFGIGGHEPWGKSISSLPISYMGLNCSLSSTSSSFRDYRFVNVFGPEGNPIPQFNPNTAGAVVIGSVTIGAGSSSYSSGPFTPTGSYSGKSRSLFALGKIASRRKNLPMSDAGISSKDDMSSISSHRSSYRANPRHGRFEEHRLQPSGHRIKARIARGSHRSAGSSRSKLSRNTIPMSHRKRQKFERRAHWNGEASYGDWKAISYMTETALVGEGGTTAAAAVQQSKFFFDTLLGPDSTRVSSSEASPKSLTCQSLPNMQHARAGSFNASASSILSESYFKEDSYLIQEHSVTSSASASSRYTGEKAPFENQVFVPWRKEGFSPSLRLSDSKQSDESLSSVESNGGAGQMIKLRSFRPAKSLFAKFRKKTKAKDWFSFNRRQYQHLKGNFALQEDPSVVSMSGSYSSHVHLLPLHMNGTRADSPHIMLGTFAAAAMPLDLHSPKQPSVSNTSNNSSAGNIDCHVHPANGAMESEDVQSQAAMEGSGSCCAVFSNDLDSSTQAQTNEPFPESATSPQTTIHISTLDTIQSDSFCAYSQNDFESSSQSKAGDWSDTSCDASSSESNLSNSCDLLDCSFAAATTPLDGLQDSNPPSSNMTEGTVDDASFLSNGTDHFDASALDNESESKAVHLIGISQIFSESESSQESLLSSVSLRHEGNNTSKLSHKLEFQLAQNETTNIISSDEETSNPNYGIQALECDSPFEDGRELMFGNDSEQRHESSIIVHSDDIFLNDQMLLSGSPVPRRLSAVQRETQNVQLVINEQYEREIPSNEKNTGENSWVISDDASAITAPTIGAEGICDKSIAMKEGCGNNVLSISWELEDEIASKSESIDLDMSFASTIPIGNIANGQD